MEISFYILIASAIVMLFLLRALLPFESRLHRRKHKAALQIYTKFNTPSQYNEAQKLSYLRKIDPYVFEELLLIAFQQKGYKIKQNKRYSNDGGIDGIIYNDNKDKIILQAKRYSNAINPTHILDFNKAITRFKAQKGYFVHTGRTGTKSYQHLTESIHIISGSKLIDLLHDKAPKP